MSRTPDTQNVLKIRVRVGGMARDLAASGCELPALMQAGQ